MNVLILEDNRWRNAWFKQNFPEADMAVSVSEFEAFIKSKVYDLIFLDHDLGQQVYLESGPGTGYEAAELVVKSPSNKAKVIIHSWNLPGAANINKVLPDAIQAPFGVTFYKSRDSVLELVK